MRLLLATIVFIALIFSQVSALETDIKDNYQPKETMIIKVSGGISSIDSSQIFFKRNNIFVPTEYDVARVGTDWYIWSIAPTNVNNYTLFIEDVETQSGGIENYQKDFSVSGQTIEYNIKPGFVVSNTDFEIELNVNDNSNHEIEIDFPYSEMIEVQPGKTNIDFSVSVGDSTQFIFIKIGDYSVPAYIPVSSQGQTSQNQTQNNTNMTQNQTAPVFVVSPKVIVTPTYIQQYIYQSNEERTYSFMLQNENNLSYKNIQVTFNNSLFDIDDDKFDLKANANHSFDIILSKNAKGEIKEKIYVNGTNFSIEIPFLIRISDNATSVASFYGETVSNGTNGTIRRTTYLCSELGGIVCSAGSTCSGENLEGRDGQCCLGVCQQPAGKSYAWIGWIIAFVVLGAGWWAYYKYKKAGTDIVA